MKVLWLESCRNAHAMQRAWWLILNEQRGLVDVVSGKLDVTQSQSMQLRDIRSQLLQILFNSFSLCSFKTWSRASFNLSSRF